jgi:D-alanyl-D-alanine carboxypeptidase/D-alanyl-D-alanine-endopeptidase (penicillin-binding protein 4)
MRFTSAALFFLFSFPLFSQNFSERKISRMLNKIKAFNNAHVAISIAALKTSKSIATYQADHYMTPASNVKLLTFLAAVENFDSLPALYYREQDSITHFKSTGYPLLLHPLYPDTELLSFLKNKQSLVYHKPKSNLKRQGPGWSWDDYSYYYAAETSPFPIYGNTIQGFGDPNTSKFIPDSFETLLTQDTLAKNFERERFKNRFHYNPKKWNVSDTLYRPFITSDNIFVGLLKDHLNLPVHLSNDSKSYKWKSLYTHQEELLYKALLQESDNGVAEALLAMISQKSFDEMDIKRTIDALKSEWEEWLPDPLEWVDGSGVSRYNMVTPRTLIAVLKKIYYKVDLKQIKNYFPQSGYSGTIKNYDLKNVFAKTGTLRHNHNLSGYWISSSGNVYVFSVMVNHFTSSTDEVRDGISLLFKKFQKRLK